MNSTRRPTIYDVAREAGVSKSLVSLVLNGSDLVSPAKREAVKAAIERLGYRPSRAAASLAAKRTRAVGLVIDDFRNPWYVDVLHGLQRVLEPEGFHIAVREHRGDAGGNAIEGFLSTQVDALVIAAEPGHDHGPLGVPVVVSGWRLHEVAGADIVSTDELQGMRLALGHLFGLRHRRIGHVTGTGGSALGRLKAYRGWMTEHRLTPEDAGAENDTNEEGGYLGARELLRANPDLTAVFAANDTMALGARAALRELGREVPGDVSLVGFDNSQLAQSRFLALTTVEAHTFRVGEVAGETLLARLRGDDGAPRRTVIAPELVVRSSTGRSGA